MRLQRAESRRITISLFVFILASVLALCVFSVQATALAEPLLYDELIPDYFSFVAPTRIAACEDAFAVFDSGKVVLFIGSTRKVFPVYENGTEGDLVTECDKLCVSEAGVYLLVGVKNRSPKIISFTLEGERRDTAYPSENVPDMTLSGNRLYTLSSMTTVICYDTADGAEESRFDLPSMWEWSEKFAFDGENFFFLSVIDKAIFEKDDYDRKQNIDISDSPLLAADGMLYYRDKLGDLRLFGEENPILKPGTGDERVASISDFAIADGKIYVADKANRSVKIFDLETGDFLKMIGSYGSDLGRLRNPVSISVKGGKIAVADSARVTVFSADGSDALKGRNISDPTDLVFAGDMIYLADGGILYEYNSGFVKTSMEYGIGTDDCLFVAAAPDGTVYASSGKDIYRKKADESYFSRFLTLEKEVGGLNIGIGGKLIYVLSGQTLGAYSQEGTLLSALVVKEAVGSFSVDYRGNVFFLSEQGKMLKYVRNLEGYAEPEVYDLAEGYDAFTDFVLDSDGRAYVIADHNVLVYPKTAFGVFIAEDSDFDKDKEEIIAPRVICEVEKAYTIAYIAPDNFEDITPITKGTRLMCYATVKYGEDDYLRVETEKGAAYIPKSDVKVYEEGAAPLSKARCLLPAIGTQVVGVNLYAEPSHLDVKAGKNILFRALGKAEVFDVISYVAVDEKGKDVWGFYRVSYQGKTAYVLADEVVSVDDEPEPMPPRYKARVKSDALGKTVVVYKEASRESEAVAYLTDGTEIYTLEPIDENKEFISVIYEGEVCYILSANLGQGGLSGGQILAIVLSVAAVVGSVLTVLILRANKKHKRYHKSYRKE